MNNILKRPRLNYTFESMHLKQYPKRFLFMIWICLSAVVIPAQAQPPVRLKLIGAFWDGPGKYKYDTLWFGMQADGAWGFQEGLDVEDTAIKKLWCTIDTVAPRRYLKTNVLPFNFKTYTKIEVFHDINLKYIKWDTSELYPYRYANSYEYLAISLISYNLELESHENYFYGISSIKDFSPQTGGVNPKDSVNIYNWSVGRLWITMGIACNEKTGSCDKEKLQGEMQIQYLSENRECKVFLKNAEANSLTVHNLMGQEVLHIPYIDNKDPIVLPFAGLPPGLYYVSMQTGSTILCKTLFAY